jgi:hypothetical protein
MSVADRRLGIVCLAFLAGCAGNTAPSRWLPAPELAGREAFGGWIELATAAPADQPRVEGELLAAGSDTVWVLTSSGVRQVPVTTIVEGKLTWYDARAGTVAQVAVLGFVSTIFNGLWLVATGPLWIAVGTAAAAAQGASAMKRQPARSRDWSSLAPYARFPLGMPPGVDLAQLRPKPPPIR